MNEGDDNLWQRVSETVEQIDRSRVRHTQKGHAPIAATQPPSQSSQPVKRHITQTPVSTANSAHNPGREVDAATMRRIKNGQIPIEAVLDLHGLSQHQAHQKVQYFITMAVAAQQRLVLIITGKGKGVLKQALPHWLEDAALAHHILKLMPAPQNKGGEGAFLLYLRRQRGSV